MINIKYGVISDIHKDPRIVPFAIDILKSQGIEKLLVNGDIGEPQKTIQDSQDYVAFILNSIGKSGIEAYIQPGSHETFEGFIPVIEHFSKKYSNLIDAIKNPQIKLKNHSLLFLPGSDWNAGGEFTIGNNRLPTGNYIKTEENLLKFENFDQYIKLTQQNTAKGILSYQNMNDLKSRVNDPDKTIIICHVPRKFDNIDTCVDMAEFGEAKEDFNLNGHNIKRNSVFPLQVAKQIVQGGYPIEIKKENRGNEDLRDLYKELGITKAVSGHFHESGHRANNSQGKQVQQGELTTDLFWNSGHLDSGQTGILTVGDGKVSYKNINLQDYMK